MRVKTHRYKKLLYLSLTALSAVLILSGCEEVINLELNDPDHQRVVVDGRITTTYGPQKIRLTQTLSYFEHEQPPALKAIEAKIVEEGSGFEFPLELIDDSLGMYATPPMAGKVGETYRLEIIQGDQKYEAEAYLDTVPNIDSMRVEHVVNNFFGRRFAQYSFKVSLFEPAPEGNIYSANVYLNDTLYTTQAGERIYFNDMQRSGMYWPDIELFTIPEKDITLDTNTVRIELFSLSEDEFNFLIGLFSESYGNGSIYNGPPANIPTNIINVTGGIDGVGFFSASDRYVIETTFLKQHESTSGG